MKQILLETSRYACDSVSMDEEAFMDAMRSASAVRDMGEVKKLKAGLKKQEKRLSELEQIEISMKKIQEQLAEYEESTDRTERERLDQPIEKTATWNMFYDEQGRHVRTKKEILDGDGNIRRGCKIIKKAKCMSAGFLP